MSKNRMKPWQAHLTTAFVIFGSLALFVGLVFCSLFHMEYLFYLSLGILACMCGALLYYGYIELYHHFLGESYSGSVHTGPR